jgi:hypothetical protein
MIPEVIRIGGVISILRVVSVIGMSCHVFFSITWIVCTVRPQITVQSSSFLIFLCLLFLVSRVCLLQHAFVDTWDNVSLFVFMNHSCIWFQLWSIVPNICTLLSIHPVHGERESSKGTRPKGPESECQTCLSGRFNIRKIMNKSLVWHDRNATLIYPSSASNCDCEWVK